MERFIKFIRSHKNQIVILTIFLIMFSYYMMQERVQAEQRVNINKGPIIDNLELLKTMFPEENFVKQGNNYKVGEKQNYFIESIVPGSFVNKDQDELLVIVRRPSDELSHVEGFYNVYMAVFDNSSHKMISEVKNFSADEGSYRLFNSKGISYIFFAGNTTYQGWSNWHGGIWQAGSKWTMKWPTDLENKEFNDFWENRAVEASADSIKIFIRKILPIKNKNQVIPDYTWDYSETLRWDKQSGSFVAQ